MKVSKEVVQKLESEGVIPPQPKEKKQKYHAKPVTVDGMWFASMKEARRYSQLKLMLQAGEIFNLEFQIPYRLVVNDQLVCVYRADYRYRDKDGGVIVEDAKGFPTPLYILKKKLMKAIYGIEIREA